jgi:hypothetical protein
MKSFLTIIPITTKSLSRTNTPMRKKKAYINNWKANQNCPTLSSPTHILSSCLQTFTKLSSLVPPAFPIQWDKSTNQPLPQEDGLRSIKSRRRRICMELLVVGRVLIILYNILLSISSSPVHLQAVYLFLAGVVVCASSFGLVLRRRARIATSILRAWNQKLDSHEQTSSL